MNHAIFTLIASTMMGTGSFASQPTLATAATEVVVPVRNEAQVSEPVQEVERLQKTKMSFGPRGTKIAKNVAIGTAIVVGVCVVGVVVGVSILIWALSGFVPI